MTSRISPIVGACLLAAACAATSPMSQARLEDSIAAIATEFEGRPGFVEFAVDGVRVYCISDPHHDRMRLIAPIVSLREVDAGLLRVLLAANYHSSLDARYAASQGIVYAAYLHPLSTLSEAELESALSQVVSLVQTFGSSFSSGELHFGESEEESF